MRVIKSTGKELVAVWFINDFKWSELKVKELRYFPILNNIFNELPLAVLDRVVNLTGENVTKVIIANTL